MFKINLNITMNIFKLFHTIIDLNRNYIKKIIIIFNLIAYLNIQKRITKQQ